MGKKQSTYRGFLKPQSGFFHCCAPWVRNHVGWAKAKKYNKRVAKRRLRRKQHREEAEMY